MTPLLAKSVCKPSAFPVSSKAASSPIQGSCPTRAMTASGASAPRDAVSAAEVAAVRQAVGRQRGPSSADRFPRRGFAPSARRASRDCEDAAGDELALAEVLADGPLDFFSLADQRPDGVVRVTLLVSIGGLGVAQQHDEHDGTSPVGCRSSAEPGRRRYRQSLHRNQRSRFSLPLPAGPLPTEYPHLPPSKFPDEKILCPSANRFPLSGDSCADPAARRRHPFTYQGRPAPYPLDPSTQVVNPPTDIHRPATFRVSPPSYPDRPATGLLRPLIDHGNHPIDHGDPTTCRHRPTTSIHDPTTLPSSDDIYPRSDDRLPSSDDICRSSDHISGESDRIGR